jgi:cation diffusion facilitator family transporter
MNNKVRNVLIYTLFLNLFVTVLKIIYGYKSGILSMTSDGFHSLTDASSNIIALVAVYLTRKEPNETFQYGYKKFEAFASVVISFLMFLTITEIVQGIFSKLTSKNEVSFITESAIVMVLTMLVNIAVSWYENKASKETGSKLLADDASHTSSDILVSSSVLISIFFSSIGWYQVDLVVSCIIVITIAFMASKIFWSSVGILSDSAVLDPRDVAQAVLEMKEIKSCHKIRSRGFPDHIQIDLHIQIDPNTTIYHAHKIEHGLQEKLKKDFKGVVDVIAHVEPLKLTES